MPSIEQVIPWLEQIFDAWEEHRRRREREAAELQQALETMVEDDHVDLDGDSEDAEDGDHRKKKKKHRKDRK